MDDAVIPMAIIAYAKGGSWPYVGESVLQGCCGMASESVQLLLCPIKLVVDFFMSDLLDFNFIPVRGFFMSVQWYLVSFPHRGF